MQSLFLCPFCLTADHLADVRNDENPIFAFDNQTNLLVKLHRHNDGIKFKARHLSDFLHVVRNEHIPNLADKLPTAVGREKA